MRLKTTFSGSQIGLTKLDEGVRSCHRGHSPPIAAIEFPAEVFQVRKGRPFGKRSLTEEQVTHILRYQVAEDQKTPNTFISGISLKTHGLCGRWEERCY